ncbi:MAG: hypothetical protein WAO49_00180 [Arcanobacterium sp.]
MSTDNPQAQPAQNEMAPAPQDVAPQQSEPKQQQDVPPPAPAPAQGTPPQQQGTPPQQYAPMPAQAQPATASYAQQTAPVPPNQSGMTPLGQQYPPAQHPRSGSVPQQMPPAHHMPPNQGMAPPQQMLPSQNMPPAQHMAPNRNMLPAQQMPPAQRPPQAPMGYGRPPYGAYVPPVLAAPLSSAGGIITIVGLLLAVVSTFLPFVDSNNQVVVMATNEPIDGSMLNSAVIDNRLMIYALIAVALVAMVAVTFFTWVRKAHNRSTAMAFSFAVIIAAVFVLAVAIMYLVDPYLATAYEVGAERGIAQWTMLLAGIVTVAGGATYLATTQKKLGHISPVQG